MAYKKTIFLILITLSLQCTFFTVKDTFYTEPELAILEKTLDALEYGYGYDYKIELNYIYSYSFSKDNLNKKEKAFADIIDNSNFKSVLNLYEKILRLQSITEYKMNKYKNEAKWKYYTYIKNDLQGSLNNYSSLLLKNILRKNSGLEDFLAMRKESINTEVIDKYTKKDEIVDTF